MRARQYIDELASRGRHHFTTAAAIEAFGGSEGAARSKLRRLNKQGRIASPMRSFHVIVPPEYRRYGCLPAEHIIDQIMGMLDTPYYVALLSAAEKHGVANQRPQALQVMVPVNRPNIICGKTRIRFIARKDLERMPIVKFNTPHGYINYSTPEATALELVGYPRHSGGFSSVRTVLTELGKGINPQKLVEAAKLCPVGWSQRLGYLLEFTELPELTTAIESFVRDHANSYISLHSGQSTVGAKRNGRWKVIVNHEADPGL